MEAVPIVLCAVAALALPGVAVSAEPPPTAAQCQAKLRAAQKLDVLYDMKLATGRALVYVGPTFFSLPIDAKEGFAETVSCLLVAGDPKSCAQIDFLHWQSGKLVAQYRNCRFKPA